MTKKQPDSYKLINQVNGANRNQILDFYYEFIRLNFVLTLILMLLLYLLVNLFFAGLYYFFLKDGLYSTLTPNTPLDFWHCFYFSVQTFATIGYGAIVPVSTLANILVTVEAFVGISMISLMTGLMFAKISRPRGQIRFAKNLCVHHFDGQYVLTSRVANLRGNEIVEANIRVHMLVDLTTQEGVNHRKIIDLPTTRQNSPFFTLSWQFYHPIESGSYLDLFLKKAPNAPKILWINVAITGHDNTYSQTIYARRSYNPLDILVNHKFSDIIQNVKENHFVIDYP